MRSLWDPRRGAAPLRTYTLPGDSVVGMAASELGDSLVPALGTPTHAGHLWAHMHMPQSILRPC